MLNNFIGWIGAILLSLCGVPEAVLAIINRNSSLSYPFLLMWLFGEILMLIYVRKSNINSLQLLFNYGINIICILIIIGVKI